MKNRKRIGYVSIEAVITAALILAVGFFSLLNLSRTGGQLVQNGLNKLDGLGIFDGSTPQVPEVVFDENGYPDYMNIKKDDINPISDFILEWDSSLNGWAIVDMNRWDDMNIVIPKEDELGNPIVSIGLAVDNDGYYTYWMPFSSWDFESVVMPNTIKRIEKEAFSFSKLESVYIPESVEYIGEMAFYGNLLTSVHIGNPNMFIGARAFNDNRLPDELAFFYENNALKEKLVSYGGQSSNPILPNGVKIVGREAFWASQIDSVVLNNGLEYIDNLAFAENKLVSLIIPETVTFIGESAFSSNEPLELVRFYGPAPMVLPNSWVFANSYVPTYEVLENYLEDYEDICQNFGLIQGAFSVFYE